MKMALKMKNRRRSRHEHKYNKYKICLSLMMVICIKQHLSNMLSSIHEKLSNTEDELKSAAHKKSVFI